MEIIIDNRSVEAQKGETLLSIAKRIGISIPTICYHPALKPSGTCGLCVVEVTGLIKKRPTLIRSCIARAKEGMQVKTSGERIEKARIRAFMKLLQMAPQAEKIRRLALAWGVEPDLISDGCIRCRLCIRVCDQAVGAKALKLEKRGKVSCVTPDPGKCIGCTTCASICPTGSIWVKDTEDTRTIGIRDEIIGRHPLVRCEGCGRMFATFRFLDHIHKRTEKHAEVKAHHNFCPTCAKLFSDRIDSFRRHLRK